MFFPHYGGGATNLTRTSRVLICGVVLVDLKKLCQTHSINKSIH